MSTVTAQSPDRGGRTIAHSDWIERAGRVGLVAKAVSYGLIGILALQVPLGHGGEAADGHGVLRRLATESWGGPALVALTIGFAGYALWRFTEAVFDRGGEGSDAKGLAKRARSFVVGVLYTISAVAAWSLMRSASADAGGNEQEETARVLDWPAGRWIVLAAAAALLADGAFNLYRGVTTKFRKRLREYEMHGKVRRWAIRSGVVGHVARGVVFAIVGVFLGKAALEYDPNEAVGIDGALLKLVEQPFGPALLGLVAAGLVAYGIYTLVEARYRRI
jgi:Domain of Unknown Function (DUF1206)